MIEFTSISREDDPLIHWASVLEPFISFCGIQSSEFKGIYIEGLTFCPLCIHAIKRLNSGERGGDTSH